jgi:DNA-binding transcriptional LysR family regulator
MKVPRTSLEQWAVLAAVIDNGGFAQAATALNRSQSAVSYMVARLQEALDVPLLAIEGRKAVLTPHGETLLKRARMLIEEAATLETVAQGLKQGWEPQLTVTVDAAFPRDRLLNILSELQTTCPTTQLQLSDAILSGAEEAIIEKTADVVVTSRVPQGFLGDWLQEVTFVAVAHRDHPLLRLERELASDDLVRHTQVVIRDSGVREPRDDGWLGATLRWTVGSMEASLAAVSAGLAYAWLPEHIVNPALAHGELKALPLTSGATRKVPLYLVLVRPEIAGPAARAAIECFKRSKP